MGERARHLEREYPLFELAGDGFVGRQNGEFYHLLGDGRAALAAQKVAPRRVGKYGAHNCRGLDSGVGVEVRVLDGDDRLLHVRGYAAERHHSALHLAVEVIEEHSPRAVVYFDRLLGLAGLEAC